jgi:hypothetical protein
MPEKTWAQPSVNTLSAVAPSVMPPGTTGQRAICVAWTGGCVDPVRGELILAANGGHNDYYGNEVYAIAMRNDSPAWVRLTDPSPSSAITLQSSGATNTQHAYSDGKPRSVHGYGRTVFGNGRVWIPGLTGMAAGNSGTSSATYSFDRGACDGKSLPLASSASPWTFHGLAFATIPSGVDLEGGPAAYDRVDNKVWAFAGTSYASPDQAFYSVDATATATVRVYNRINGNPTFSAMWAVVAHDLRVALIADRDSSKIWVLNLSNPGAGLTPIETGGTTGTGGGAVYHKPSRAVLCWNNSGTTLRKLAIPSNPLGSGYSWSTISAASGNSVSPQAFDGDFQGCYSKFNIIEDMGNGQSALVLVTSNKSPVYVYKLPMGAIS